MRGSLFAAHSVLCSVACARSYLTLGDRTVTENSVFQFENDLYVNTTLACGTLQLISVYVTGHTIACTFIW